MKKSLRVTEVIGALGAILFAYGKDKKNKQEMKHQQEFSKKIVSYYALLNQWLKIKQQGKSLTEYFHKNDIQSIAIYGYKELGERLYDELKGSDIEIKYIIDKNIDYIRAEIDVYSPDESLPQVDAIVVTATYYYDEIEDELNDMGDFLIISLEDVVI
ncbi:MAG TPA: hypothetical protein DFK11_12185 [Lachnospiraceae bacterium]|nr:hypothetical protein [Lachnospiraceae bacterium]